MFVKKFEANSMEEALAQVKGEMGPNALILSTQRKNKSWFQKPVIEVTAAHERKIISEDSQNYDEETLAQIFPHRRTLSDALDRSAGVLKLETQEQKEKREDAETSDPNSSIRKSRLNRYVDMAPQEVTSKTPTPSERHEESFLRLGFAAHTAKELTRRLIFDFPREDRATPQAIERAKLRLVTAGIQTLPLTALSEHPTWAFIGLPGAGKTSLIVKLALLLKGKKETVSLVGLDSRKLAARTELAAYAKFVKLGFSTEAKVNRDAPKIQLLDTSALSYHSDEEMAGLERQCHGSRVVLVLDATTRLEEQKRALARAQGLMPFAVAYTRLDLIGQAGVIYDLLRYSKLPLLGEPFRAPSRNLWPATMGTPWRNLF